MRWFEVLILLSAAVGFISGKYGIQASPVSASTSATTSTASSSKTRDDQADSDPSESGWQAYKAHYEKKYSSSAEDTFRRQLRENNLRTIQEHNDAFKQGLRSFTMGGNELLDWTPAEYKRLLGLRPPVGTSAKPRRKRRSIPAMPIYYNTVNVAKLPTTVNWTASGLVGPVLDQGYCGSCWAYSSVGAIGGQYKKKTKNWVNLSEQNLIDCSFPQGNGGCDGGNMDNSFWYVQSNGINSLAVYPDTSDTTSVNGTCLFSPSQSVTKITSWYDVNGNDEKALQQAVAQVGPVAAGINAGLQSFQYYQSGVYTPTGCSPQDLNHAVLVVGYGVSGGKPYWLIKNSWGTSWGMNGYMMMARNKNNTCGIAAYASFPLI